MRNISESKDLIKSYERLLKAKDTRIRILKDIVAIQKRMISLLEKRLRQTLALLVNYKLKVKKYER